MFLIKFSYQGLFFLGSQRQKEERTIQRVLENFFACPVKIYSRTDRYVNSRENIALLQRDDIAEEWVEKFNRFFVDINIHGLAKTDFCIEKKIISREYVYVIQKKKDVKKAFSVSFFEKINRKKLEIELDNFVGRKNFRSFSFRPTVNTFVRNIYAIWIVKKKNEWHIHIRANGFLRKMVRHIISFCLAKASQSKFKLISPFGLYLHKIHLKEEIEWKKIK